MRTAASVLFALLGALVLPVLLLAPGGCSSGQAIHVGPDPQAGHGFRAVVHVNGDFDGQTFVEAVPTSALVRAHGSMTVTLRAYPAPFLVIDGDGNVIVEPLPGQEAEAMRAVREGAILIRRNGVAGDLNAPARAPPTSAPSWRPSGRATRRLPPPAPWAPSRPVRAPPSRATRPRAADPSSNPRSLAHA